MVILRGVVFLQLFSCVTLLLFKRFGSNSANDVAALDWLFIFAYPMAYLVLLFVLVLVAADIFRFSKDRKGKYLVWIFIDILVPVSSYLIFEEYYRLIGHM